jgi:hypothetical protein
MEAEKLDECHQNNNNHCDNSVPENEIEIETDEQTVVDNCPSRDILFEILSHFFHSRYVTFLSRYCQDAVINLILHTELEINETTAFLNICETRY